MYVRNIWDDENLSDTGKVIGDGFNEGTVLVVWGDDTYSTLEDMADLKVIQS